MKKTRKTLSIIIPAYDEEATISLVIEKIFEVFPDIHEIVIVNDGSKDKTKEIIDTWKGTRPVIKTIHHEQNQGKTAALSTGIKACTGDIIIVQDADLEYDPADIPVIIEPIEYDKADVVYGSRFLVRKASRVLYFRHYLANKLITFLSNLFTDLNFTDIETGYKAFRGNILKDIEITSKGFGVEVEITAKIAKRKLRIYEVPISYYGRTYEEGKKIGFKDGLYAIYYIFKFNLFS